MFVRSIVADAFGTNCYVVAPEEGEECVLVDAGFGVVERVREVLAQHRLRPAAVLLTHGHLDHVYSVTPVCGGTTAAYIHGDDAYRLKDPVSLLTEPVRLALEQQFGRVSTWTEPERVVHVRDREVLELAGLQVEIAHAPGHTEGSVLFSLPALPHGLASDELDRTVLSGDVLFAGSIGRTDLPGGDHAAMERSLRDVVMPLADSSLVLPGHGPATTMARERRTNPYLLEL
ncbi:MBL fold metallo-hydrolase [Ornithinimicrobium cerasi]|uniref:Glyoxylase, beta-lactamase superfamily II n=1 Tax=Ornithinimicrobium cerasi TaxID=2248773 RepID=A0A285VNV0_9MICO|nr:MBL fold metallo-hydrolase [Ornithinimicrobium cerasi]SOC54281.1 Glyoxylase, beta-lactamase superfamily II [Ornithinimicrobium cerasi]